MLKTLIVLDILLLFAAQPIRFPEMRNPHFWDGVFGLDLGLLGFWLFGRDLMVRSVQRQVFCSLHGLPGCCHCNWPVEDFMY